MALPPKWRVAGSVRQLHRQLRPLAPNAPAVAFGTVADTVHTEASDHYPKVYPGLGARPVVCAGDFPKAERLNPRAILDAIRRSHDPRVKYGISEGRQFSSYAAHGFPPWTWRPYGGSDGHFDHGHLSVVGDARADQTHPWQIGIDEEGDDVLTPDQQQQLTNIHDWLYDFCRGLTIADAGTPHIARYVPNEILTQLRDRPPVPLNDAQLNALASQVAGQLAPQLEAAAERAVRRVLGSLDDSE